MEVTIQGQTVTSFIVTVKDEKSTVDYDMEVELRVADDDGLPTETRDCAAKEHFWHQIALDSEREADEFEKTWYAVYCAHTERYARYYLKGQGEKNPTGTAKEKAASLIFSQEANRSEAVTFAYQGYSDELVKVGLTPMSSKDFEEDMYHYTQSMEEIEKIRISLRFKTSQLKAIAAAFNTKSWSIKTLAADKRALMGAHM